MTDQFQDHIKAANLALENASFALAQELREYPTPVSGCDAQYNFLLAERRRVLDAQAALQSDVFVATPRSPTPQSGIESR